MYRTALCVLAVFAALGAPRAASAEAVRVVAARANVRERPDLKSPVIAGVRAGAILQVEGRDGDWYRVRVEGAAGRGPRTGYISAALVTPEATEPAPEGARPLPPAPAAPAASKALSIEHKPVGCLVADRYPKMEACFNPASRVSKARLHFRAEGTPHWYNVTMKPEGTCFSGVMPKPRKKLKRINYYIDVVDPSFAESRTEEYAPEVVSGEAACKDRLLATFVSTATVVVSTAAGAPALPAGFATTGVVAASSGAAGGTSGGAAADGAAAGAGAGASAGGLSTVAIGLIAGGAVVGVATAVVVARGGEDPPDPATVDNDGDGFTEIQGDCNDGDRNVIPNGNPTLSGGRFESATSTCPDGVPSSVALPILVDARNNGCAAVTVNDASVTFTVTNAQNTQDQVGNTIPFNNAPFAPNSLAPGTTTSVRLNIVATCTNPTGGSVGFTELAARVTLNTSAGPIAVDIPGTNRVNFPLIPGGPPFPGPSGMWVY